MSSHSGVTRGGVESAIATAVRAGWGDWFPGRAAPPSWQPRLLTRRPGAALYVVPCGDGQSPAGVLAKVRTAGPREGNEPLRAPDRPMLTTGPLSDSEATAREFRGLVGIQSVLDVGAGPIASSVRAVRPLALLEDRDTILMDLVDGVSLRDRLVARTRLVPRRRAAGVLDLSEPFHGVGAWLRVYQDATVLDGLTPRHGSRPDVVAQFLAFDDYLTAHLGPRLFPHLGRRGADLAEAVLPERLDLAVAHHDFAPRNVLLGRDGLLSVIDPLWRWAVPAQEDLCRFLVGVRLLGLQVHTRGLAFPRADLHRLESGLVAGYYGDRVPWSQLRCYEALILLDKWAALVSRSSSGVKGRAQGLSLRSAAGFIAREVVRALEAGEGAPSTPRA